MNYDYLKYILQLNNTPSRLFSLVGGLPNECVCIENNNNHWGVYYSERGKKLNLQNMIMKTMPLVPSLSCCCQRMSD